MWHPVARTGELGVPKVGDSRISAMAQRRATLKELPKTSANNQWVIGPNGTGSGG